MPKQNKAPWVEAFKQKARRSPKADYKTAAAAFIASRSCCEVCGRGGRRLAVHHKRGRLGALLLEQSEWMAVCFLCHRWIHDNPNHARAHGWLCKQGYWNRQLRA